MALCFKAADFQAAPGAFWAPSQDRDRAFGGFDETQRGRLVIRRFRASMWQKGSQLAAPVTPCGPTSNPRATVCTQHNGGGGVLLQKPGLGDQVEQMGGLLLAWPP